MRSLLLALAALLLLAAGATAAPDPLRGQQYGLDIVEAEGAHAVATGEGAVVAIVDTGVLPTHEDLAGRLLPGKDFVDDDLTPQDGNGHGTHLTGIVAANAQNGLGVSSVAPGAKVLPVRVLDDDGSGSTADVARGIEYAIDQGADVINLSLGDFLPAAGAVAGDPRIDAAIDRALDKGIVVVAAAGNNGVPVCEQSAGRGRLICVGSVDKRRQRSFFSSFGNGLGVVAPGGSGLIGANEDILSTASDGKYEEMAGTSQATPHVAGVAALLVSRGIRGQDAVRRILSTATDAGPSGPDPEFGAGIVNARAAVTTGSGSPGSGGGGGGTGGGDAGASTRVSIKRGQRKPTVRRRGLVVRCRAAGNGRCSVTVSAKGRRIARGSRAVTAGRTVTFRVRTTRAGRRILRGPRKLKVSARFALPGADPVTRRALLRP